jgi:hypothetical protein
MGSSTLTVLLAELCELAAECAVAEMPLIIGGGVGLLLRDQHLRDNGASTIRPYPSLRATTDLDIFLTAEVISDPSKTEILRSTLDRLGFHPVEGAEYYQFVKAMPAGSPLPVVKVDLLAPSLEAGNVSVDERRIRPHGYKGLHAHVTPEAITIQEYLTPVALRCRESAVAVFLPHPFSYVLLKLYAFRDRREDPAKDLGRYHAFDIYTSIAMMTEEHFLEAGILRKEFEAADPLLEAREIVGAFFDTPTALGALRIREHARQVGIRDEDVDLDGFLRDLRDLLAP